MHRQGRPPQPHRPRSVEFARSGRNRKTLNLVRASLRVAIDGNEYRSLALVFRSRENERGRHGSLELERRGKCRGRDRGVRLGTRRGPAGRRRFGDASNVAGFDHQGRAHFGIRAPAVQSCRTGLLGRSRIDVRARSQPAVASTGALRCARSIAQDVCRSAVDAEIRGGKLSRLSRHTAIRIDPTDRAFQWAERLSVYDAVVSAMLATASRESTRQNL
jgi:hypothetical protein